MERAEAALDGVGAGSVPRGLIDPDDSVGVRPAGFNGGEPGAPLNLLHQVDTPILGLGDVAQFVVEVSASSEQDAGSVRGTEGGDDGGVGERRSEADRLKDDAADERVLCSVGVAPIA